jgi:hypothetical protein
MMQTVISDEGSRHEHRTEEKRKQYSLKAQVAVSLRRPPGTVVISENG